MFNTPTYLVRLASFPNDLEDTVQNWRNSGVQLLADGIGTVRPISRSGVPQGIPSRPSAAF